MDFAAHSPSLSTGKCKIYCDVTGSFRKTSAASLWSIFERVRAGLNAAKLITWADVFSGFAAKIGASRQPPFECAVVDEAQDIRVAQLRFLAALGAAQPNRLFFAGDLGERIYQQPFSWKVLGVDIRGRSSNLRINYRTSIRIPKRCRYIMPLHRTVGRSVGRRGQALLRLVGCCSGPTLGGSRLP